MKVKPGHLPLKRLKVEGLNLHLAQPLVSSPIYTDKKPILTIKMGFFYSSCSDTKKLVMSYKPDSVRCRGTSLSFIQFWPHDQNQSAYPLRLTEVNQASYPIFPQEIRSVHGISTHKVYPTTLLLRQCVRSYRTISPLPAPPRGRHIGGIVFCDTFCLRYKIEAHPLDGVVLYVVRTFLTYDRNRSFVPQPRQCTHNKRGKIVKSLLSLAVSTK